ncbi:hypothetical protein CWD92_30950 [Burkholderia thailandensis]|nr:hypothetical protein AQ475_17555 [Burkholderia thailandensis]PJO68719.1 hypothetical protein CWD92_30950 [Burkholderia thailandensis]
MEVLFALDNIMLNEVIENRLCSCAASQAVVYNTKSNLVPAIQRILNELGNQSLFSLNEIRQLPH